jgi:hypothetical protein
MAYVVERRGQMATKVKKAKSPLKPDAVKLLRRVKRHILEVPERYRMGFIYEKGTHIARTMPNPPKCETIGCFAGWICALGGIENPNSIDAAKLLGISPDAANRLFFKSPRGYSALWSDDGTKRTAQLAARRLELFIRTGK